MNETPIVERMDTAAFADIAVRAIAERWQEPDAGIWELEPRPWTHSRLTCVAGLRALANAAPGHRIADTCTPFVATAATSVHADGHWQRAPDDPSVDAALPLPAVRGALPAPQAFVHALLLETAAHLAHYPEQGNSHRLERS
ncbi:hypothetical protein [Streptomyces broussonetiae]|uniref:hypothetical protein n=1 Tax=Streptomyces broussonetiae TaxID=2686304 RepID=UPI001E4E32FD|nr:hypothetical protein [Streptomyces broussonetiae]